MTCKIKRRSLRCGGRPKADFGSLFTSVVAPALNATGSVVDESIVSEFDDFEDAMQYYSALKVNADVIITRNIKDFAKSKITVMTTSDFLSNF